MKKLMFAAAALVAGFAMADGIASANIVGYSQSGLREGAKMTCAQFSGIELTEGGIDIMSITTQGEDAANVVVISRLGAYGDTEDSYVWVTDGGDMYDEIGWQNDDMEMVKKGEVIFTLGEGLWVEGGADLALQSAGSVQTKDAVCELRSGARMCGNSYPIAVDIMDVLPEGEDIANTVVISRLGAYGDTLDSYVWVEDGGSSYSEVGWQNDDMEMVTAGDVMFAAGEGLWVEGDNGQTITFPAPEL